MPIQSNVDLEIKRQLYEQSLKLFSTALRENHK